LPIEEVSLGKHDTIARRRLIVAGAAGILALGARASARAEEAAQKLSQADAAYQDTPKNGQQCSECTRFQPPQGCSVVEGKVSPRGWCKLYEAPPE
jgi:hypothetical protein